MRKSVSYAEIVTEVDKGTSRCSGPALLEDVQWLRTRRLVDNQERMAPYPNHRAWAGGNRYIREEIEAA